MSLKTGNKYQHNIYSTGKRTFDRLFRAHAVFQHGSESKYVLSMINLNIFLFHIDTSLP